MEVSISLYRTAQFQELHSQQPKYLLGASSNDYIFLAIKLVSNVPSDVGINIIHLWASPGFYFRVISLIIYKFHTAASSSQEVYYAWILQGCETHSKVSFLSSPNKQELRISLPVFMFEGRTLEKQLNDCSRFERDLLPYNCQGLSWRRMFFQLFF